MFLTSISLQDVPPYLTLIIIGAIFVIIAIAMQQRKLNIMKSSVEARATVVDYIFERHSRGNGYYYPLIEFELKDGTRTRRKSFLGSYPKRFKEGQTISIRYKENNPDSFFIINDYAEAIFITIFFVLGIAAMATGAALLIFAK
jgi:hypothetical protein